MAVVQVIPAYWQSLNQGSRRFSGVSSEQKPGEKYPVRRWDHTPSHVPTPEIEPGTEARTLIAEPVGHSTIYSSSSVSHLRLLTKRTAIFILLSWFSKYIFKVNIKHLNGSTSLINSMSNTLAFFLKLYMYITLNIVVVGDAGGSGGVLKTRKIWKIDRMYETLLSFEKTKWCTIHPSAVYFAQENTTTTTNNNETDVVATYISFNGKFSNFLLFANLSVSVISWTFRMLY